MFQAGDNNLFFAPQGRLPTAEKNVEDEKLPGLGGGAKSTSGSRL
jgi:hypothetical protein